jgi:hypothetical protein
MAVYRGRRRLGVLEAPDDLLQDMAQRLGAAVVDVGEAPARARDSIHIRETTTDEPLIVRIHLPDDWTTNPKYDDPAYIHWATRPLDLDEDETPDEEWPR